MQTTGNAYCAAEVWVGCDGDFDVVFRQYLCDFFRPFDKAEAVSGKVVFSSYVEGFLEAVDTVEIKVVDWKALCALVFVNDGEGGAVYDVVDSESLADGFDESGFAGPHLAVEGEDVAFKVGPGDVLYEVPGHLVYFFKAGDGECLEYVFSFFLHRLYCISSALSTWQFPSWSLATQSPSLHWEMPSSVAMKR